MFVSHNYSGITTVSIQEKLACLLQAFAQGISPHDSETCEKAERCKQPLQRLYIQLPNQNRDVKNKQLKRPQDSRLTDLNSVETSVFPKREKMTKINT